MRLTVLGGCGGWPEAGRACSGYPIEQDGFRLLIDPGCATFPLLLDLIEAGQVDAAFVSHEHPDHCADLNPLLRARALSANPASPLPVYALLGALDAVLTGRSTHPTSARRAGRKAAEAEAKQLLLTHLRPGSSQESALLAAGLSHGATIGVATGGLVVEPRPTWGAEVDRGR